MFNRYEYLVNRLFITEKIEGWREAGLMPEDEYEELLNMSVTDSTSQP